jgi:hypothetical protein
VATAFREVQDAIVAALQSAPAVAGGRVHAGRDRSMPAEHTTDVAVSLVDMQAEQIALTGAPVDWSVQYAVTLRARGSDTVNAVAAIDPLLEAAYTRLVSTQPPTGVMGWLLQPRMRLDIEEAATPIASLDLVLDVRLRTSPGGLAIAA